MERKVLVPVNESEACARTIAGIIGRRDRFPGPLTLLHVVDIDKLAYRMIPDFQLEMIRERALKAGEQVVAKWCRSLEAGGISTLPRIETGSPRNDICRIANDEAFDLLIIGRRGMGEIRDVLFGSVANHVLHQVRCPVLLF